MPALVNVTIDMSEITEATHMILPDRERGSVFLRSRTGGQIQLAGTHSELIEVLEMAVDAAHRMGQEQDQLAAELEAERLADDEEVA